MTISQFIFEQALQLPNHCSGSWRKAAISACTLILRVTANVLGDPVVRYEIDGRSLALPISHALPVIRLRHPGYATNIGRIATVMHRKYPSLSIIDIGANVGDTIAMIHAFVQVPMLCIDGDERFFSLLALNAPQWRGIEVERAFVAGESGMISGRIQTGAGSGHIVLEPSSSLDVASLASILKRHSNFSGAKLVKVDTDGFDTLIVKGSVDLFSKLKPAVFFEYDPYFFQQHDPEGFSVFAVLRECGYRSSLFFENTGEFLARVRLDDVELLSDLHHFCSDRGGKRYFDVLVTHADDDDVLDRIRDLELSFPGRRES